MTDILRGVGVSITEPQRGMGVSEYDTLGGRGTGGGEV